MKGEFIERLAVVRDRLVAGGELIAGDRAWLAEVIETTLIRRSRRGLAREAALRRRNIAIRELVRAFQPGRPRAIQMAWLIAELRRYERRWHARDKRTRLSPPASYAGRPEALLHQIFVAGDGRVPLSAKQLRRILLSRE